MNALPFVFAVVIVVRKRLLFVFLRVLLKEEEEEELEGTDPEAFGEFRRCAQESPHPDDVKEDDDAMMMKTL